MEGFPVNSPELWQEEFPKAKEGGHKYDRGHAVIFAGGLTGTGAARLAAKGALRAGAGLVTLGVPGSAIMAHAGRSPDALMVKRTDGAAGITELLSDERMNAICLGPAYGVGEETVDAVTALTAMNRKIVLDADALSSFAGNAEKLAKLIGKGETHAVLTPHEGEFARLFGDSYSDMSRTEKAVAAAKSVNAVIVLKGAKTVIAAPDGNAVLNKNAPPQLATAGSGDVLGGIVTGLLAQGMPPFGAACAGVWLHGEAGNIAGTGLIADDLPEVLRVSLKKLQNPPQAKIGFGN